MKIKVNWLPEPLELTPCDFDHTRHHATCSDTRMEFKHNDKRYRYTWASGGGMGLSSLAELLPSGDWKTVYDLWRRDWQSEHAALHEAARQLSVILKHPKP